MSNEEIDKVVSTTSKKPRFYYVDRIYNLSLIISVINNIFTEDASFDNKSVLCKNCMFFVDCISKEVDEINAEIPDDSEVYEESSDIIGSLRKEVNALKEKFSMDEEKSK